MRNFAALSHKASVGFVGELDRLPVRERELCGRIKRIGASAPTCRLTLAIAYDPVEDSRRELAKDAADRRRPIDVIVRTSGERRTSGFLPMQTLYNELAFIPALFPDVSSNTFAGAIGEAVERERRMGA
jgi:undecaprenyl pyrophosphate synthase